MNSGVRDAGFTLAEAMIAGALGIALILPGFRLLQAAYGLVVAAQTVALTNAAARQSFTLLADGTSVSSNVEVASASGLASARGFGIVEGLRSRQTTPAGSSLRVANQFTLSDGSLQATGDTLSPLSIQCLGPAMPHPDCLGTETLTVAGWIGAPPVVTPPSAQIGAGKTAAVSVVITNPFGAQRAKDSASATQRYRMMFNLNPDAIW